MTIILGSYTDFENRLLVAAYYTANRLDKDIVTLDDITEIYELELPQRYAIRALSQYWANGLTLAKPHLSGIGTQPIGLTADGLKAAERLIGSNAVELQYRKTDVANETTDTLSQVETTNLLQRLVTAERQIDKADLSNTEKAQARAYIVAIRALAEAPEPPRDLIWEIISRANNVAGIAALFVSIAGLFA